MPTGVFEKKLYYRDVTGQTFGWLTAIKRIAGGRPTINGIRKRVPSKYLCHCKCGKEIEVIGSNLIRGNSTSCGCRHFKKWNFVDLTGRIFGLLTVLRRSEAMTKTRGSKWVCQCQCGGIVEIPSNGLTSGNNITCGNKDIHYRSERVGDIPLNHVIHIKNNATKRNLIFNLEPEYLWNLFLAQNKKCSLTGVELVFTDGRNAQTSRSKTTASLDRINNQIGYVVGNVRWVHKDVNKMRGTHDDESFLAWCQKCINYRQKSQGIPLWHDYFLNMCDVVKTRSPDPNTQVGCVVVGSHNQVLSTGYNGMPFGVATTPERLERPTKYIYIEHGDRNCLYLAARSGVSLLGAKMYLTGLPCIDCARGIIQAGLSEIIIDHENQERWAKTTPKYAPDFQRTEQMLAEAGVKTTRWVRSTHQEYKAGGEESNV